jgi:hypothetical protein
MRVNVKVILSGALFAVLGAGIAKADVIPYPNIGTINPVIYSFTATSAGDIIAYFFGSSAGNDETIGLLVNGVSTAITGLDDHSSNKGETLDLGHANKGDVLVFTLQDLSTSTTFYSNPALNPDSLNHVYSTSFSGDNTVPIPKGIYLSFEDLTPSQGSDFDYNDTQFVVTNVTSGVPEASTWVMMLIGFAAMGAAAYRRSMKFSGALPAF